MGLTAAVVRIAGLEATFFRETEYVGYSILADKSEPGYPKPIQGNWPGLPWDRVDAVVNWNNGKLFFFNGPQCLSFDVFQNKADAGEPKAIKAEWPGVPWDALDAVVLWNNGKGYFFKGTEYVRFDVSQHRVDAGYPQPIKGNWPGMPWDRIDTVVNWGNGKAYFFRDQKSTFDTTLPPTESTPAIHNRLWTTGRASCPSPSEPCSTSRSTGFIS